jgi:hypothetical protein
MWTPQQHKASSSLSFPQPCYQVTLITITRGFKPYIGCLGAFIIACAGEWVDRWDDLESLGYWRWQASAQDSTPCFG